jgi:alcohol dehydrogenase
MTAYHGLAHRGETGRGEDVVIHGLGGVGLSGVQIADALGANVIGVDLMDEKLEKAEELGAIETVNAAEVDDPAQEVKNITNGGADVSVDALGIATTCKNAVNSLGGNGIHVQIGLTTQEEGGEIALPTDVFVQNEIDFRGSLGLQPSRYGEILDMMETGKLEPEAIVSDEISIEDVPDRIAAMSDFETVGIPVCTDFS